MDLVQKPTDNEAFALEGDVERLAIAQALYKACGKLVDTTNPDSLRAKIDEHYKQLYDETGAKTYNVRVRNNVVGTYSLKFSKKAESSVEMQFEITDYVKLAQFVSKLDEKQVRHYVEERLKDFADWYVDTTGEVPDGCEIKKVVKPAVEPSYMGGVFKVNLESVADALTMSLVPVSIAGLLEGAYE